MDSPSGVPARTPEAVAAETDRRACIRDCARDCDDFQEPPR